MIVMCSGLKTALLPFIYRIDEGNTVVVVAAVGIRRAGDRPDVYEVAERLARLGLI